MIHPRRSLALLLLAIAALTPAGCGGEEAETASRLPAYRLLAGFDLAGPGTFVSRRRPLAARLETGAGREPALFRNSDFDVSIRMEGLGGSVLRGHYGLLKLRADGRKAARTRAVFRVRLSASAAEPGLTLFEDRLDGSSPTLEELAVPIPDSSPDVGFLSLEVSYPKRHHRQLTAAWIDPVLVTDRPVRAPPPPNPWNVLLITSDTTRQDVLSCYGGSARTPALERLAADGVTFTNAFSVAFGTTPSHASLLTASPAAVHGVYDNSTALGTEETTLQELLQARGYATAAFVSARPLVRSLGFARGFDLYDDLLLRDAHSHLGKYSKFERRADVTVSRFIDWLGHRESGPFFSWIHLFDPHQPYAPPPGTAISTALPEPRRRELIRRYFRSGDGELKYLDLADLPPSPPRLTEDVDDLAQALYRAEIEVMDGHVGRILEVLQERDLYRRTLIVFVADHGENFTERNGTMAFRHASLFSEVARLPLIVKLPGSEHAGTTRDFLLGNLDLAPTILDALGLAAPDRWNGRSFLPLLAGDSDRRFRPHLVLEGVTGQELAVRTTDWMYRRLLRPRLARDSVAVTALGYEPGKTSEIFNLRADPSELTRTAPADCPEYPKLSSIADKFLAARRDLARQQVADPEHLEALKALGYVD